MTDVRLTALNPEDSQVYPVACNSSGELKLEKQATFDGNLDGDLTVTGSATFKGLVQSEISDGSTFSYFSSNGSIGGTGNIQMGTYMKLGGDKIEMNLAGDGSASFAGVVSTDGAYVVNTNTAGDIFLVKQGGTPTAFIQGNGSATFAGDVVIGSRSKQWMLVEQGGLCHMVEQVKATTADLVDPAAASAAAEYPKLRDVFQELNTIERCLEEVMTKLRMTEPDGWPVWDGSDNSR